MRIPKDAAFLAAPRQRAMQSRPTWNRKRYNAGWFMGTP